METIIREPAVPLSITHRLSMLTAVHLDNEAQIETEKIRDVRADRHLPAKFEILEASVFERKPELPLSVGHPRS